MKTNLTAHMMRTLLAVTVLAGFSMSANAMQESFSSNEDHRCSGLSKAEIEKESNEIAALIYECDRIVTKFCDIFDNAEAQEIRDNVSKKYVGPIPQLITNGHEYVMNILRDEKTRFYYEIFRDANNWADETIEEAKDAIAQFKQQYKKQLDDLQKGVLSLGGVPLLENALSNLPPKLETLNLPGCNISSLPDIFNNKNYLPDLQELDLSWNNLSSRDLYKLPPNLETLVLTHNRSVLDICRLKGLKNLKHATLNWKDFPCLHKLTEEKMQEGTQESLLLKDLAAIETIVWDGKQPPEIILKIIKQLRNSNKEATIKEATITFSNNRTEHLKRYAQFEDSKSYATGYCKGAVHKISALSQARAKFASIKEELEFEEIKKLREEHGDLTEAQADPVTQVDTEQERQIQAAYRKFLERRNATQEIRKLIEKIISIDGDLALTGQEILDAQKKYATPIPQIITNGHEYLMNVLRDDEMRALYEKVKKKLQEYNGEEMADATVEEAKKALASFIACLRNTSSLFEARFE